MENTSEFRRLNTLLSQRDIRAMAPLELAYIGDAVYELCVRTYIIDGRHKVNALHNRAVEFVSARSQARIVHELDDFFTEEEKGIIKRGRNAKSHSTPKNVDFIDYKYSTGFEALVGYLYLMGRDERIRELFLEILKLIDQGVVNHEG